VSDEPALGYGGSEPLAYLLDTNVISEGLKPNPDANVMRWMQATPSSRMSLSVITIGEIVRGITKREGTKRGTELKHWLEHDLIPGFQGRILPLTEAVMRVWGEQYARAVKAGLTPPLMDSLLAATAAHHGLILVTRNTVDLAMLPVTTLNPWID
jgi:toxin FitB